MLALETQRFKDASVVKINKLGNLVSSFKPIRSAATGAAKAISAQLTELSSKQDTAEARNAFVSACTAVAEHNNDFVLNVAKKVGEAQKSLLLGLGKGMAKISTSHGSS
jgi:N-terminal acetyltransferase B complex non-catalytic subunit